jgi:sulfur carrier protein
MRIFVNDEPRQVQPGTTVAGLVEMLGSGRRGVAVAVAAEVVPRSAWERVELADGDRVEVLRAVQGGCG